MTDQPFRDAIVRWLEARAQACLDHAARLSRAAQNHSKLGTAFAALARRVAEGAHVDVPMIITVLENDLTEPVSVTFTVDSIGRSA